jgi:phosphoribosyl-AMP cyclohydrolase
MASPPGAKADLEEGLSFSPRYGEDGLIPAIVTEENSGRVLMFAYMNAEALALTLETGFAHFWTRSRQKIWLKGEESGNRLRVTTARTDCDQDVVWLAAVVEGNGVACHTARKSCFYRRIVRAPDGTLSLQFAEP